jgi:hypothetical protein
MVAYYFSREVWCGILSSMGCQDLTPHGKNRHRLHGGFNLEKECTAQAQEFQKKILGCP